MENKKFANSEKAKVKVDFDYLRKNNLLLYEYVRGSRLYGLDRPESDEDHGGVYIEPLEKLIGTGIGFPEDVHSDKNDDTWYSLGKYAKLLLNSNPNIIESLFVPSDKILYKNPAFDIILKNADKFITKKCFGSFAGYARTQLMRARSLKKKVVIPENTPEPFVIDSVFTFQEQGSIPVTKWLEERGLKQKYCGLVNVPNMSCNYSCFYDFGAHTRFEYGINTFEKFKKAWTDESDTRFWNYVKPRILKIDRLITVRNYDDLLVIWKKHFENFYSYRGIVKDAKEKDSKQLRLCSVKKGETPICYLNFDTNAYTQRCIKYKEWQEWLKCRNEERYQEVLDHKMIDCKNALHCARLMTMGIEIAQGKGVIVDRRGIDRDFLMKIREGQFDYEELMKWLENKDKEMLEAMKNSTIPDEIDIDFLDSIIYQVRKSVYGI